MAEYADRWWKPLRPNCEQVYHGPKPVGPPFCVGDSAIAGAMHEAEVWAAVVGWRG